MGRNSSQFLIAFVVVMMMAIAAYIKIWTIDYQITSQEAQLLRQQFDLAHREAMDESAEWRQRFDVEVEKTKTCIKELDEIVSAAGINSKLEMLEKENMDLLDRIEIMKQKLEAERFKCGMQQV